MYTVSHKDWHGNTHDACSYIHIHTASGAKFPFPSLPSLLNKNYRLYVEVQHLCRHTSTHMNKKITKMKFTDMANKLAKWWYQQRNPKRIQYFFCNYKNLNMFTWLWFCQQVDIFLWFIKP